MQLEIKNQCFDSQLSPLKMAIYRIPYKNVHLIFFSRIKIKILSFYPKETKNKPLNPNFQINNHIDR